MQFTTDDSVNGAVATFQHRGQRTSSGRCNSEPWTAPPLLLVSPLYSSEEGGGEAGFPSELDGAPLSLYIFAHYHLHQRISMRGLSPITSHENPWPSGFFLLPKAVLSFQLRRFQTQNTIVQ